MRIERLNAPPQQPLDKNMAVQQLWKKTLEINDRLFRLDNVVNIQGNLQSILENISKALGEIEKKAGTVVNFDSVNHELLSGLLGGAANDHQHITTTEKSNYDIAYAQKDIITNNTGFLNNKNVIVTGDSTTRKITLTGTGWTAYYKGVLVPELTTGWVSGEHGSDTTKQYFLDYNGTSYEWIDLSTTALDFSNLLIAYTFYDTDASEWVYLREPHGMMDDESHKSDHKAIGTFKVSGGTPSGYVLDSTTAADRRPDIAECTIRDEDVDTVNSALTSKLYTQGYLDGAGATFRFTRDASDIISVNAAIPYYNQFTGGAWQKTAVSDNTVFSVWAYAIPMCAGTSCQKYRFVFIHPQWVTAAANSSAGAITAATEVELTRSISELSLGTFRNLVPEVIGIIRFTIAYIGGATNDWVLKTVTVLDGTRSSQVASPAGGYLSVAAVDGKTIDGNALPSNPLKLFGSRTNGQILKANVDGLPIDATNTDAQVSAAVTASHAKQHAITSSADHTSTATPGQILKADANGLPVDSIVSESGGKIGVGTPTPSAMLHIEGVSNNILLRNTDPDTAGKACGLLILHTKTGSQYGAYFGNLSGNARYMTIGGLATVSSPPTDASLSENSKIVIDLLDGNVGIGTTTPANRLEVKNSAVNTTGIALQRFGGTQQIIRLFEDANGRGIIRVLDEGATDKIYLAADGDCYINPLNSGKLGVGTTTPAEKLDVNGNIKIERVAAATVGAPLQSSNLLKIHASRYNGGSPTDAYMGLRHAYFSDAANTNHLEFVSSVGTTVGVLMNNGDLGVGLATTPAAKLDVVGSIRQNYRSLKMSTTISQAQSATNNYIYFKMAIPARTAVIVKAVFIGTHSTAAIKSDIELLYSRGDGTSSASVITANCNSTTRTIMYTVDAGSDELWIGILNSGGTSTLVGELFVEILSNKNSDISGSTPRLVSEMVAAAYTIPTTSRFINNTIATTGASLDGGVTINESGAAVDFRVEGDTDPNLIVAKGSTDKVGIGTTTPAAKLDVAGTAKAYLLKASREIMTDDSDTYRSFFRELPIETDDVDVTEDVNLPASCEIAHIVASVYVYDSGVLGLYGIADIWLNTSNSVIETTWRCQDALSKTDDYVSFTYTGGKLRIVHSGTTGGATNNRVAVAKGQIVEYMIAS